LAAPTADAMLPRFEAAVVKHSGTAVTKDISTSEPAR
jgi:hypothetical protein